MNLTCEEQGTTVIDTDWEAAGVSAENFDDVMGVEIKQYGTALCDGSI